MALKEQRPLLIVVEEVGQAHLQGVGDLRQRLQPRIRLAPLNFAYQSLPKIGGLSKLFLGQLRELPQLTHIAAQRLRVAGKVGGSFLGRPTHY